MCCGKMVVGVTTVDTPKELKQELGYKGWGKIWKEGKDENAKEKGAYKHQKCGPKAQLLELIHG